MPSGQHPGSEFGRNPRPDEFALAVGQVWAESIAVQAVNWRRPGRVIRRRGRAHAGGVGSSGASYQC